MTDETNAQTLSGLAEGTTTTTETQETKTPKGPEGQAEETTQTDSTATEQEAADNGEQSEGSDDAETEGQDRKPRRSRSDRYKSRIAALLAENAELVQRLEKGGQPGKDSPKAPKLEDFNYDQQAFDAANAEFIASIAGNAASEAVSKFKKEDRDTELRQIRADRVEDFNESVAKIKDRISDYDAVVNSCNVNIEKRPDIGDAILSSDKGAHLLYELAKNGGIKLKELMAMPPIEAARAIGRIEARLSLPQPKKQTQAPAPIKPPVGGASPSRDASTLAKSEDIGDYIAMRNEQERKRA